MPNARPTGSAKRVHGSAKRVHGSAQRVHGSAKRLQGSAQRIEPAAPAPRDPAEESLEGWGFRDTGFRINAGGHVELTGSRYALAGQEMPDFLPWVRGALQIPLEPVQTFPSQYPPHIPAPRTNPGFLDDVRKALSPDAIRDDAELRLRHGHGHTLDDVYRVRSVGFARVPDVVLYPSTEEQVVAIVEAAVRHDVCVIPYGGGTSVSSALACRADEARSIASIDMGRMNRVLWIDPVNRTARIEAGVVGRHLVEQLAEHGFTLGHEPDSVEFSTLGGWIATNASGMKKNRYGNIEDLLLDVRAVTPAGVVSRENVGPRESASTDVRRWLLGSEGALGVVTSAVLRITPLPELQVYDSLLFRGLEPGFAFLYDLQHEGGPPASVRLLDNVQFQFGQALGHRRTGVAALRRKLERAYVTGLRGFSPDEMTACTLVFEGSRSEVAEQRARVARIAKRHGGLRAGASNGARGYQLTFGIAYIRDFVLRYGVFAESFETSIAWSGALEMIERVKRRVRDEHARLGLPGVPVISARITQLYATGVCVYFYLAACANGHERPNERFGELEHAARDEILNAGGSISHHHGVGKLRQPFLPRVYSEAALDWAQRTKRALDPSGVFGSENGLFGHDSRGHSDGG